MEDSREHQLFCIRNTNGIHNLQICQNASEAFGIIPGVTDKNYITNSYHVHVTEEIDAFSKLKFESEFQKLSPGGAISYIEVPNMQDNIPAVLSVMKFIYDNIMYAELNTKSDYCECCGYDGEIKIVKTNRESWSGNAQTVEIEIRTYVCCKTYLWIYRNTVLESGTYTGDQGSSTSSVIPPQPHKQRRLLPSFRGRRPWGIRYPHADDTRETSCQETLGHCLIYIRSV